MKKIIKNTFTTLLTMLIIISTSFTAHAATYTDVASNTWYYNAVMSVTEKGYMSGTGDNKFEPTANLTRAMFVQILANYTTNYNASNYSGNTKFSKTLDFNNL